MSSLSHHQPGHRGAPVEVALALVGTMTLGCPGESVPPRQPAAPVTAASAGTAWPAAPPAVTPAPAPTVPLGGKPDGPPAGTENGPAASQPNAPSSAPAPAPQARFDAAQTRRFEALRARAWQVVNQDGERQALCQRLEGLKASHPNLQGCVAWVDQFPDDLCTRPAPPPSPDGLSPLQERLNHECYWHFYVGENMGTHTNRHFTLVVDAGTGRLIGARLSSGSAISGPVWSRGATLRRTLHHRLAAEPAIRKRCQGSPACPSVEAFASDCGIEQCFLVSLGQGLDPWAIRTDAQGKPTHVYDPVHQAGQPLADWLVGLGAQP